MIKMSTTRPSVDCYFAYHSLLKMELIGYGDMSFSSLVKSSRSAELVLAM